MYQQGKWLKELDYKHTRNHNASVKKKKVDKYVDVENAWEKLLRK